MRRAENRGSTDRVLRDRVEEVQGELKAAQLLCMQAEDNRARMAIEVLELEAQLKTLQHAIEAEPLPPRPASRRDWPWPLVVLAAAGGLCLLYLGAAYWFVVLLLVMLAMLVAIVAGVSWAIVLAARAAIIGIRDAAFRRLVGN